VFGIWHYQLQVIFKSFKLAPVMIGSALLLKKRYSGLEKI